MLIVVDHWKWLSEETRVVQEDNRGPRAIVDAPTIRISEVKTEVLKERERDKGSK